MAKTLRSTMPRGMGERILLYGPAGAGKSTVILQIARACPGVRFFIIDAEQCETILWLLHTEFKDVLERDQCVVRWIDPNSWVEWVATVAEFVTQMGPDDWLVIDPLFTWKAVQEYHQEQAHGRDWVEHYEKFTGKKNNNNWPAIKARHDRDFWRVLRQVKGHILITARAKGFSEDEKPEVLALYGSVGGKPEGEALLGHWPHSVVHTRANRRGEVVMTSLKERGRRGAGFDGAVVRNFAYQYLKDIAGWELVDQSTVAGEDQFATAG